MRFALRVFLSLAVAAALCAGIVALWYFRALRPVDEGQAEQVLVTIAPGSSARAIAECLQEQGLIRSARAFVLAARLGGYTRHFVAGDYLVSAAMSSPEIIKLIASGKTATRQFTIPEGFTLAQIAARLEHEGICRAEQFLRYARSPRAARSAPFEIPADSLEGYLFPDTYRVPYRATPEEVAGVMLARFKEKVADRYWARAKKQGWRSLHEVVTLASIVEREAKLDEERPIIAQVFIKRLRMGMLLESCATINYILGEQRPLTEADLAVDSPYNTYVHRGLPPGPICSPGEASVRAVVFPANTDYLYFRARGDGGHIFSRTFEEHLRAAEEVSAG